MCYLFLTHTFYDEMDKVGISVITGGMTVFNYKFQCWFSLMNHFLYLFWQKLYMHISHDINKVV